MHLHSSVSVPESWQNGLPRVVNSALNCSPRGGGCFCHGQRLCTPATVNAERFTPIDSGNIDKSLNFLIMSRDPLHCAPSLFEPGALAGRARSSILCRHAYG